VKERRGYIILVLISVFLSGIVVVYGTIQQDANDHKFCDLFNTLVVAKPIPKPANPKTDPSRARSYDIYVKFRALDRSLGCLK
jgi:hypothetical protein